MPWGEFKFYNSKSVEFCPLPQRSSHIFYFFLRCRRNYHKEHQFLLLIYRVWLTDPDQWLSKLNYLTRGLLSTLQSWLPASGQGDVAPQRPKHSGAARRVFARRAAVRRGRVHGARGPQPVPAGSHRLRELARSAQPRRQGAQVEHYIDAEYLFLKLGRVI